MLWPIYFLDSLVVAAMCEASCTWSGKIPPKNYKNPTTFSCKVFLGGVPWDITEGRSQASGFSALL